MPVWVRSHQRRQSRIRFVPPRRRPSEGGLSSAIDEVVTGRRAGYTWTRDFKFDIDDPVMMKEVYKNLHGQTLYAVAVTNRTLAERGASPEGPLGFSPRISRSEGISLWRRADGTVFMDNIVLFFGPAVSEYFALNWAKRYNQQVILKVDGLTKTWEFLDVPGWKVAVKGKGAERVFEPTRVKE